LKLQTNKQKVSLEGETKNPASAGNFLSQLSEFKETSARKDCGGDIRQILPHLSKRRGTKEL